MSRTPWVLLTTLLLGCGSAQTPVEEAGDDPGNDPDEESSAADDDGMEVEGLRGSLQRDEVDPVLNVAARRFAECYATVLEDHPYLVGDLALQFTVARDGSVREVWTSSATLGSREVEECVLRQARGLRFPRPHGGETDLDYGPMVMHPGDDAQPPDLWPASRISEQLTGHEAAVRQCMGGGSGFQATLYVGPGGRVRSVGVVAPSAEQQDAARCLEHEIAGWEDLPDPGDWVAKITLEL